MEIWQAHYQDELHDVPCTIENHWGNNQAEDVFKMCIDGVTFVGSNLDDWELSKVENQENINSISKNFSSMFSFLKPSRFINITPALKYFSQSTSNACST